jgi:hypothetical protein
MFENLALPVLIVLALYSFCYGVQRYKTLLNPLTIHVVLMVGLFTIGSAIASTYLTPGPLAYSLEDMALTCWLSTVNLFGVVFPYWFKGGTPARYFGYIMSILGLNSEKIGTQFSASKFSLLIFLAVVMYIGLALTGGGGSLWLTDPREAYLWNRAGAGHFFILTQWFLTFAFLYYLFSLKPKLFETLIIVFIFSILLLFLGKKQTVVLLWVIGFVYYNFYIAKIKTTVMVLISLVGLFSVLGLIIFTGGGTFLNALQYFEYFNTTTWFLSRFEEFGYYYGRVLLTSMWVVVPRAWFPDKPFEYGASLIHQVLYPGFAEAGITPGYLIWSPSYLDFGVIGVLIAGLISGISQRMSYEYYLTHRKEFIAFGLMLQFSIMEIWVFVPAVIVFAWSILQVFILRLRLTTINSNLTEIRKL